MNYKENINSRITRYVLQNSRITFVALLSLIIFGLIAILTLRTTGFPSPEIKIAVVNTVYPGASANTVLDQVSRPLEVAVKGVEGVKSYSSTSADNFSSLRINIEEKSNVDAVKAKLDSAIRSVNLPEGVQKPEFLNLNISGDEYYYAITRNDGKIDTNDAYIVTNLIKDKLQKNKDVEKVTFHNDLTKKIGISIDPQNLTNTGISYTDVSNALKTLNFNIPIAENAEINGKRYNLTLALPNATIEDIRNLRIIPSQTNPASVPSQPILLNSIAEIKEVIVNNNDNKEYFAYRNVDTEVKDAILFNIKINDSADLKKVDPVIKDSFSQIFDDNNASFNDLTQNQKDVIKKYQLTKIFSRFDDNQKQVAEVVSGFIGEKWHIGKIGYIGFVFGGIELVFLVMLALVSWRAAIVAALALPLSFFFSLIYIQITGNELNTLVLFSLVLVIGLVVDPALVVLEAIQRNLDNGMNGKEAAIHAVHDIGYALFLAVVTSILVFAPFGVVSGIFGQIISYIPLTIIPALVGSYVVPIVFLTWIGSRFLKKKKNTAESEEANLWPAARWMHRTNSKILNSPAWVRLVIILLALLVPVGIAVYFTSSGKVKSVQFAQSKDGEYILINISNYPQKSVKDLEDNNKSFVKDIINIPDVNYISPFSQGGSNASTSSYLTVIKPKSERKDKKTASQIAENINNLINGSYKETFFFAHADVLGAGPSNSSFPIAIGIKTDNLSEQKKVALDLTKILNQECILNKKNVEIKEDCNDSNKVIVKVNNGYDSKEVKFIEILLNKQSLALNPVNPITLRTTIANLYNINNGEDAGKLITENNTETPIIIIPNTKKPQTIDDIKNIAITTLDGRQKKISDIADIKEVQSVAAITRINGETVGNVSARAIESFNDQSSVAKIQNAAIKKFKDSYASKYSKDLVVENYSEGDTASIAKSFTELGIAFILAVILTYIVLVVFFNSFTQPLVILFAIPLTFIGIFPALYFFAGGQLGFLEIIGIIILVGLVENVAIFLIDAANQRVKEGWEPKEAIAYASAIRFRPIILTKITTLVSTAPLAILSEFYRSLSVVIIFGLLTSGILSLFVSPILYIYFRSLSKQFRSFPWWGRLLFAISLPAFPITLLATFFITKYSKTKN